MSPESQVPKDWRLRIQRLRLTGSNCPECKIVHFPPRRICPDCGHEAKSEQRTAQTEVSKAGA